MEGSNTGRAKQWKPKQQYLPSGQIKATNGNYYKLRFPNMSATDGSVRSKPEIKYLLVK